MCQKTTCFNQEIPLVHCFSKFFIFRVQQIFPSIFVTVFQSSCTFHLNQKPYLFPFVVFFCALVNGFLCRTFLCHPIERSIKLLLSKLPIKHTTKLNFNLKFVSIIFASQTIKHQCGSNHVLLQNLIDKLLIDCEIRHKKTLIFRSTKVQPVSQLFPVFLVGKEAI